MPKSVSWPVSGHVTPKSLYQLLSHWADETACSVSQSTGPRDRTEVSGFEVWHVPSTDVRWAVLAVCCATPPSYPYVIQRRTVPADGYLTTLYQLQKVLKSLMRCEYGRNSSKPVYCETEVATTPRVAPLTSDWPDKKPYSNRCNGAWNSEALEQKPAVLSLSEHV